MEKHQLSATFIGKVIKAFPLLPGSDAQNTAIAKGPADLVLHNLEAVPFWVFCFAKMSNRHPAPVPAVDGVIPCSAVTAASSVKVSG